VTTGRVRDRGAASSLSMVVLTPVFVVLAFAAFQAAMWSHARTEARVIARDAAAAVARSGVPDHDARQTALAVLVSDTDLANPAVEIRDDGSFVTVTVRGRAPGLIRGTSSSLSVTAVVPVEGWRS
jgi:Flp pilus assembly protein TadG